MKSPFLLVHWIRKLALGTVFTLLIPPALGDAVTDWNKATLQAIRAVRENPPRASRILAMTHLAVFDGLNAIDPVYHSYSQYPTSPPPGTSPEATIASAAFHVLESWFQNPDVLATNLSNLYQTQLATVPDGLSKSQGIEWGQQIAASILSLRANDQWNATVDYTPVNLPGRWVPTPPANAPALLPNWAHVTPFTLISGSQFRPQAPPPITSAAYTFEFNVIKWYGGATSTVRNENQSEIARFWDDGLGTATPPGHWNEIAQSISTSQNLSLLENARLFALLNLATADAAIAAWDSKYVYDYWRPITAIPLADSDGNPETEPDVNWTSYITTPPFPEYTSGHSTFSRSCATILEGFFGTDDIPFSTTSDGTPGVIRSYPGFSSAADEAGISRIYGGIHWPSANLHGQSIGRNVGHHVLEYFLQPIQSLKFSQVSRTQEKTQLELQGEPSTAYEIRVSSDLNTWELLGVYTTDNGSVRFSDPNAGTQNLRFYQAIKQVN